MEHTTLPQTAREEISAGYLYGKILAGEPVTILDVRVPDEYHKWKIEGRTAFESLNLHYIDFIEDEERTITRIPGGMDLTVVCARGDASDYVAEILRKRGFAAWNLTGGMQAWSEYYAETTVRIPGRWDNGLIFKLFNRVGKGCLSYLIGAQGCQAAVIDPSHHLEVYLRAAEKEGLTITHVFDTHLQADHLSGGRALADVTGATYHIATVDLNGGRLQGAPMGVNEQVSFGQSCFEAVLLATPGHTPGSTALLLDRRYLFTGDTLFVNTVGRPDLGGKAREWAHDLYNTLFHTLAALPDTVQIFPSHYASIHDINPLGLVTRTLGELRRDNPLFRLTDEARFCEAVLAAMPEEPGNFERIRRINLGLEQASPQEQMELETGPNRCAAQAA
jgi:glyoxylase-like metal-dependent hydrolase (beta-lactamase superfamily II)/rhodanese-related sulfurtransferase